MARNNYICPNCKSYTYGSRVCSGSFMVELFLWIFLTPLVGIIYTVWRLMTSRRACHVCKHLPVIPLGTPVANEIAEANTKKLKGESGQTINLRIVTNDSHSAPTTDI